MSGLEWPAVPTPGRIVRLPLGCPAQLVELSGYDGAGRLVAMENTHMNARRIALRKAGGGALFALAVAFFCGLHLPDPAHHAVLFLLIWLAVFLLVGCIMILAFIDLRMTRRLHAAKSQKPS